MDIKLFIYLICYCKLNNMLRIQFFIKNKFSQTIPKNITPRDHDRIFSASFFSIQLKKYFIKTFPLITTFLYL